MGLSAALHGEITLEGGRIEQEDFDTYVPVMMWEMPTVESLIVPTAGFSDAELALIAQWIASED